MRYDIRLRGHLDRDLVNALGDITITVAEPDTILNCRVPDTAALVGILRALTQQGLAIREIRAANGEQG